MQVILRFLKTLGKNIRGFIDSFLIDENNLARLPQSLQTITADNFFSGFLFFCQAMSARDDKLYELIY